MHRLRGVRPNAPGVRPGPQQPVLVENGAEKAADAGRLPVSIWQQVAAIAASLVGEFLMHDSLWQPATMQNDSVFLGLQAAEAKD